MPYWYTTVSLGTPSAKGFTVEGTVIACHLDPRKKGQILGGSSPFSQNALTLQDDQEQILLVAISSPSFYCSLPYCITTEALSDYCAVLVR